MMVEIFEIFCIGVALALGWPILSVSVYPYDLFK